MQLLHRATEHWGHNPFHGPWIHTLCTNAATAACLTSSLSPADPLASTSETSAPHPLDTKQHVPDTGSGIRKKKKFETRNTVIDTAGFLLCNDFTSRLRAELVKHPHLVAQFRHKVP